MSNEKLEILKVKLLIYSTFHSGSHISDHLQVRREIVCGQMAGLRIFFFPFSSFFASFLWLYEELPRILLGLFGVFIILIHGSNN